MVEALTSLMVLGVMAAAGMAGLLFAGLAAGYGLGYGWTRGRARADRRGTVPVRTAAPAAHRRRPARDSAQGGGGRTARDSDAAPSPQPAPGKPGR